MTESVAVVDLRGKPQIVRRFLTIGAACEWMARLSESRSYEVFACVGDGIQQFSRDEQQRVRRILAAMHEQYMGRIGALSSSRYNDDGDEVQP